MCFFVISWIYPWAGANGATSIRCPVFGWSLKLRNLFP